MKYRQDLFDVCEKMGYVPINMQTNVKSCPNCGCSDIDDVYVNCLCHRTYEGDGRTCWTAPKCKSCGFEGHGNSDGGAWFKWYKR